ncbi:MAG: hypothetical protein MMC33_006632 [Icmadophila ericetorum]|nr:hypothetical protein [Icmadophila ericetorum]
MSPKIQFSQTLDSYLISTDPTLLSLPAINAAFGSPQMYWCSTLPEPILQTTLDNSLCLGLYQSTSSIDITTAHATAPKSTQIGLARLITDHTTFAYLTDVYILPEYQGKGLGVWLIECVDEVLSSMPHLRRACLVTGEGKGEEFYRRKLGMRRADLKGDGVVTMHRLGPDNFLNFKKDGEKEGEKGH